MTRISCPISDDDGGRLALCPISSGLHVFFGARVLIGVIRILGASRGDRGYRRSGDRGLSPPRGQQGLADERFAKETTAWRDLYTKNDVASIVLQERHRAEAMAGSLDLTSKTVADIGCGHKSTRCESSPVCPSRRRLRMRLRTATSARSVVHPPRKAAPGFVRLPRCLSWFQAFAGLTERA